VPATPGLGGAEREGVVTQSVIRERPVLRVVAPRVSAVVALPTVLLEAMAFEKRSSPSTSAACAAHSRTRFNSDRMVDDYGRLFESVAIGPARPMA
jgi:hypothetical protein